MKYLFLILCLVLCCCTKSAPDGGCSDPPKLSKKGLLFNFHGGVDSLIVDDSFWWLGESSDKECKYIGTENEPDYCNNNYCKHDGDVSSNLFMKIECPWFYAQQISEYTIFVSVDRNETGEERKSGVDLQAGNCSSWFSITQSGE